MINYERVLAEINLDNIAKNVINIKKNIPPNTKLMAIVKADAYGHGSVEVAKTCLYNGANFLGVAIIDEAIELRQNNIFEPILILGYTKDSKLSLVISNNITQTIFSYDMAKKLSDEAIVLNKSVDIHIKIDTGMGRLGFFPNENSIIEIIKISNLPFIKITGIFTHFATSDEADKTFTILQLDKFNDFINKLNTKLNTKNIIKHFSNSGAILDFDNIYNNNNFDFDMVRAGIILYGLYPSENVQKNIPLFPAMSIKTHVSFIKEVEANTSISYARTYFTNKKTKIACIPVGYADGYARCLSNKSRVIINNHYANVIGTICMDQFMVDITDIPDTKVGDSVILMGSSDDINNNLNITAEELASLQNTINYEIICNIGKRVPRVFIKKNEIIKLKKLT